jgi:hypothetical protein
MGLGPSRWWVRHPSGVSSRSVHTTTLYRNTIGHNAVPDIFESQVNRNVQDLLLHIQDLADTRWIEISFTTLLSVVLSQILARPTSAYIWSSPSMTVE